MTSPLAGVRVAIGVSGAGKTRGIRSDVERAVMAGARVVVIDSQEEWSDVPPAIARWTAGAPKAGVNKPAVEQAIEAASRGARLVVYRGPSDAGSVERLATWAATWNPRNRDPARGCAGLAIPEAHELLPNSQRSMTPSLGRMVTAWRHRSTALWVDTQRMAMLSATVLEQATSLRLYAIVGRRSLAVARELGGDELVAAILEAARRLAPKERGGRGEAGWHVELGLVRVPPYVLSREP